MLNNVDVLPRLTRLALLLGALSAIGRHQHKLSDRAPLPTAAWCGRIILAHMCNLWIDDLSIFAKTSSERFVCHHAIPYTMGSEHKKLIHSRGNEPEEFTHAIS